jgi:DNA-binding beta-propeller fold protein YncE
LPIKKYVLYHIFFIFCLSLFAQNIDMDMINANEEFRIGVNAFHGGFYNKAILAMERSLALKPENALVREWLGRSYYQSGYENAALNEWDNIIEDGSAGESLMNFRNMVYDRRGLLNELKERDPWVELIQVSLNKQDIPLFSRPTSVDASRNGTGSYYVVNFAGSNITQFDANGNMINKFDGGIDNFYNPFDIKVLDDGRMLISEYSGDRISLCTDRGYRSLIIGKTGTGNGDLLGPQYIALSENYFYVTDWGNSRVVKYDLDGNYILDFGRRTRSFEGLSGPSGIVVSQGKVYVADVGNKKVFTFDESGNYLSTLIDENLSSPEGLTIRDEGDMLIADGKKILTFDFESESLREIFSLPEGESGRIMKTAFDENNNLIVPDFNNNRISLMTELSTLYGGLFVTINKIDTALYPEVLVDFTVLDRFGNPCVGLDSSNFLIKEEGSYLNMIESQPRGPDLAVSLLFESSREVLNSKERIKESLKELLKVKRETDIFSYLAMADTPHVISEPGENPIVGLEENWELNEDASLDTALRMAGADLMNNRSRRTLFFFTQGELSPQAFDTYGLVEMGRFLKNNDISFYPIYMNKGSRNEELEYLASETGGEGLFLLRSEGLGDILSQVRKKRNGNYTVSFESQSQNDFGRAYLPLSIEVNYLKKSGRDELGYFAPLDFTY